MQLCLILSIVLFASHGYAMEPWTNMERADETKSAHLSSCLGSPVCLVKSQTVGDVPDVSLKPPMQTNHSSWDWVWVFAGGVLGSGAGFLAGGVVGGSISNELGGVVLGAGAGTLLGSVAATTMMGSFQSRRGSFAATVTGAILGGSLGLIFFEPTGGYAVPIGAGVGAATTYLLSDTSRGSFSLYPSATGASMNYSFSF